MSYKNRRQQDYDNPFGPAPGSADSYYVDQYLQAEAVQKRRRVWPKLLIALGVIVVVGGVLLALAQTLLTRQSAKFTRSFKRDIQNKGIVDQVEVEDQPVDKSHFQLSVNEVNRLIEDSGLTGEGFNLNIAETVRASFETPLGEVEFNGIPRTSESGNPLLSLDDVTLGGLDVPNFMLKPLINSIAENGLPISQNGSDIELHINKLAEQDGTKLNSVEFDLANGLIDIDADLGKDSTLHQYLP